MAGCVRTAPPTDSTHLATDSAAMTAPADDSAAPDATSTTSDALHRRNVEELFVRLEARLTNVVYRWEYMPGSTLFLVWNHGRQGFESTEGNQKFSGDVRDLFRLHPANTFLVKMSYWLNR